MGLSTVRKVILETCSAIWEELVEEFMTKPTREQLKEGVKGCYNRWQFPDFFLYINGKYCHIKCLSKSGSHYFNYLHYHSILLQGVADADKKFVAVDVGGSGQQSNGGTFAGSALFRLLEAQKLYEGELVNRSQMEAKHL
jgi:hypothetical protein